MVTTPNKGYAVQTTGDNVGTWGDVLNDDMISIADSNLGGLVTKTLAGSNITLTADESECVIVRLIGTISANIQVTNPCIGFYFVENLTTGAFAVTVTNGVSGVVVPSGQRMTLIADATNGVRIASSDGMPSGTTQLFRNSSAPTGWTKLTNNDNKGIRIVSGSLADGGTVGFSTLFTGVPTGTIGGTTLTINQIPGHTHPFHFLLNSNESGNSGNPTCGSGSTFDSNTFETDSTGGGQSHTHTFTGTTNLALAYCDVIAATKV